MAMIVLKTEIAGKVWKITAARGARLDAEEPVLILESMKMEIPVACEKPCTVVDILVAEGDTVAEGTPVARVEA